MLESATHRLVRAVDQMSDQQWASPSLLPGWTRAHVVAHLALNAEALVDGLEGVHDGTGRPMYPSQESRDGDIVALASAPPAEVRDRFLGSSTLLAEAVAGLADNLRDATFPRTPGSDRVVRAGGVEDMRLREVEIHHADLDLGYGPTDWPDGLAAMVLDFRATLSQVDDGAPGFTASATDLEYSWVFGTVAAVAEGPIVRGASRDLAWWTTGRGTGDGLASRAIDDPASERQLPQIGAW